MPDLVAEHIPAASAGIDSDSSPSVVASTKAPLVQNFLVDRPGKLVMRGPVNEFITLSLAGQVGGELVFNNKVQLSTTELGVGTREPWVAPYRKAAAAADLARGYTSTILVDLDTGTAISGNTSVPTCGRSARVGNYAFGIQYNLNSNPAPGINQNGGYLPNGALVRWSGTGDATADAHSPTGAQAVKAHLSRLFVLGGADRPGGLTNIEQNTLYWSDPGGPVADTAASWQDDVSGLTNKIVVDVDDGNDFGVALAKVGQNLVIFKRRSVHQLIGTAPSNFIVRPFSAEQGCLDARTVVEHESGCFFLSEQGFIYFDGAQMVNVSDQTTVHKDLLSAIQSTVGDSGSDWAWATAVRLRGGYILLTLGTQVMGLSWTPTTVFSGLFSTRSRAWTTFSASSSVIASGAPKYLTRTATKIIASDGAALFQLNKITVPEGCTDAERGFDNKAGTKARIPAKFHSRLAALSTPVAKAQIHRYFLDYRFSVESVSSATSTVFNSGDDGGVLGWYVSLVDGTGNVLMPETQVPAQGDPSSYLYRRRFVIDNFAEANDVQVQIQWKDDGSGTYMALPAAEIYDSWIEYSPARQKTSS